MSIISAVDSRSDPDGPRAKAARECLPKMGQPTCNHCRSTTTSARRLKCGGAPHILAWYARSLAGEYYDVHKHPSFDVYARGGDGVSPTRLDRHQGSTQDLKKRFPPCPLLGLGPALQWEAPKRPRGRPAAHAEKALAHRYGSTKMKSFVERCVKLRLDLPSPLIRGEYAWSACADKSETTASSASARRRCSTTWRSSNAVAELAHVAGWRRSCETGLDARSGPGPDARRLQGAGSRLLPDKIQWEDFMSKQLKSTWQVKRNKAIERFVSAVESSEETRTMAKKKTWPLMR